MITKKFYYNPIIFWLIIVGLMVADCFNIFQINDQLLHQNPVTGLVVTLTMTIINDFSPILLGDSLVYLKTKRGRYKHRMLILFALLTTILGIFFYLTMMQKITSGNLLFSDSSTLLVINGQTLDNSNAEPTAAQKALLWVLALLPIGTSILSLFLSYSREQYKVFMEYCKLRRKLYDAQGRYSSLKSFDKESAISDDEKNYEHYIAMIQNIQTHLEETLPTLYKNAVVAKIRDKINTKRVLRNELKCQLSELEKVLSTAYVQNDDDRRYESICKEVMRVRDALLTLADMKLVHDADSCTYISKHSSSDNVIKVTKIS